MHADLTAASADSNKALTDTITSLREQVARLEKSHDPVAMKKATVSTSLRAMHGDWDEISTSPEWEKYLAVVNPLVGLPNGQLLEWRQNNHTIDETLSTYTAMLNAFRELHPSRDSNAGATTRSMARPRVMAAGAPAESSSVEQEIAATKTALSSILGKTNKTTGDVAKMNKLYDRMRALASQIQPAPR
jgi:hypothetical protein